jgi:hypothetical protein
LVTGSIATEDTPPRSAFNRVVGNFVVHAKSERKLLMNCIGRITLTLAAMAAPFTVALTPAAKKTHANDHLD